MSPADTDHTDHTGVIALTNLGPSPRAITSPPALQSSVAGEAPRVSLPSEGSRREALGWIHRFTPNQGKPWGQLRTQHRDQAETPIKIPTALKQAGFMSLALPFLPGPAAVTQTG